MYKISKHFLIINNQDCENNMKKFTTMQLIFHKIKKLMVPIMSNFNKKKLNNIDFTIISNNCWAGVCYEYFNLPKNSPTIGSYFFADDYIKLIKNLKFYFSKELEIINANDSKHFQILKEIGQLDIPIGKLDDIELVLLHYKNPIVAREKWKRRVERINWDNIIVKFSQMSKCTDEHIKEFQKINGIKKFCFVPKKFENMEDLYLYPSCINSLNDIGDDVFYWNRYINVIDLINKPITGINQIKISN